MPAAEKPVRRRSGIDTTALAFPRETAGEKLEGTRNPGAVRVPLKAGGLKRSGDLRRKTRIPPVNAARRAERFERDFGREYRAWISLLPCCWCAPEFFNADGLPERITYRLAYTAALRPEERIINDPAHGRGRGAGGRKRHQVPACRFHHEMYDGAPLTSIEETGVDPLPIAARLFAVHEGGLAPLPEPLRRVA